MPGGLRAAGAVPDGEFLPIQLGEEPRNELSLGVFRGQAEEARHGLVAVGHPPLSVDDQHAVFDGIEEGLEEIAFAGQALDHLLEVGGIKPPEASEDFIEKTGLGGRHRQRARERSEGEAWRLLHDVENGRRSEAEPR